VVELAAVAGLSALALTDHDNLDGIAEASSAADRHGIRLIPGTELSVEWPQGAMHMLVYFLDPGPGPLQDRLAELQASRHERNLEMVAALRELGIDITWDEVDEESGGTGTGRPHLAAVLVRKGVVADIPEAFDTLLAKGRPAYRNRIRLDYAEAAGLARASGAVPVVAHPHTIGVSAASYEDAFREVAAAGVLGIEAYYAEYTPEVRTHLAALAGRFGMVPTGGSDYHGSYKVDVEIGVGRGDLVVPDRVVDELLAAR
jgi:predicted metal-dependent phosphoesterase TrpH